MEGQEASGRESSRAAADPVASVGEEEEAEGASPDAVAADSSSSETPLGSAAAIEEGMSP